MKIKSVPPTKNIQSIILVIRGQKVVIDSDLANIYGVTTKRLNEQVRRNLNRFPQDFIMQLTKQEKNEVVAICDHLHHLKFSPFLPYAFTEHGAVMVANLLNSPVAIKASILVVRAFVRFRESLILHKELSLKFELLEGKVDKHDKELRLLFDAIRQLISPRKNRARKIGFKIGR